MGKAYRNGKIGRTRKILLKKKAQAMRPLPEGRVKHLNKQIERLEAVLKAAA